MANDSFWSLEDARDSSPISSQTLSTHVFHKHRPIVENPASAPCERPLDWVYQGSPEAGSLQVS